MTEPWERQPGESSKAFYAFTIYRDLGPKRSLRRAAEIYYSGKSKVNLGQIEYWSYKYHWVERVQAWDDYQDRLKREAHLKAVEEMADRHVRLALALQAKAAERLKQLPAEKIGPAQLVRMIRAGVEIERKARGLPDWLIEIADLSDEELVARYKELLERIGGAAADSAEEGD